MLACWNRFHLIGKLKAKYFQVVHSGTSMAKLLFILTVHQQLHNHVELPGPVRKHGSFNRHTLSLQRT